MVLKRVILSIVMAFFFYAGLDLFFGMDGVLSYRKINHHKNSLQSNLEQLKERNRDLLQQYEGLRTDSTIVQLLARELGYIRKDEKVIFFNDYEAPGRSYFIGDYIHTFQNENQPERYFRALSISLAIILFIMFSLAGRKNTHHKK